MCQCTLHRTYICGAEVCTGFRPCSAWLEQMRQCEVFTHLHDNGTRLSFGLCRDHRYQTASLATWDCDVCQAQEVDSDESVSGSVATGAD